MKEEKPLNLLLKVLKHRRNNMKPFNEQPAWMKLFTDLASPFWLIIYYGSMFYLGYIYGKG